MDAWNPKMLSTSEYIDLIMKEEEGGSYTEKKQVGGKHYSSKAIQPWDYISSNNLCYFSGNAVKYVSRYKDKGGVEDLRKAIHYLEKLIEIETGK